MTRTLRSAKLALATLAVAFVAACALNLDFAIDKDFVADAAGTSVDQIVAIDLNNYSEYTDHKSNFQDMGLNAADLSVTAIGANNKATKVTGRLALRAAAAPADGSQDVLVGEITDFPIALSSKLHIPGNPAADKLLVAAVKGDGKFTAVIKGATDGEAHFTLHVKSSVHLAYGLF